MLNRKIETTFAPTGNLVPAVWQGRGSVPQERGMPKELAPTLRLDGDTAELTVGETSRHHRWQIMRYLQKHAGVTAKEISANVETGRVHKRLANLLSRGYIVVVQKPIGKRLINHYSLKPQYCEPE